MAKKLSEIYVDITGRLEKLKAEMSKAKGIVSKGLTTLTKWAKRGAMALGAAIAAGLAFATKAAMKQQDVEMALMAALQKTGDATEENIKRFKEFAQSIQKVTKYGDEDILMQMAYGKNLGINTEQLEAATKAAAGLAAKYKIDLNSAMMLVGRAALGQTQMLTRYGIVLGENLTPQEKFNKLLKMGADAFYLAEEEAKTTAGSLAQLRNVIGDVAEGIGNLLLPKIKELATGFKEWLLVNEQLITQKTEVCLDKISGALSLVVKHIKALTIGIISLLAVAVGAKLVALFKIIMPLVKFLISNPIGAVVAVGVAAAIGAYKALTYSINKTIQAGTALIATTDALIKKQQRYVKLEEEIRNLRKELNALEPSSEEAQATRVLLLKKEIEYNKEAINLYKQRMSQRAGWATKEYGGARDIEAIRESLDWMEKQIKKRERNVKSLEAELTAIQAIIRQTEEKAKAEEDETKLREKLSKQLDIYEKLEGYEKEAAEARQKLYEMESKEYEKLLEGKLTATQIYDALIKREEEKSSKESAHDRLRYLLDMYDSMTGYEKKYRETQLELWKEQAKEYAKTGLITYEAALAGIIRKHAEAPLKEAADRARAGFVGFQEAWGDIARQLATKRVEQSQLEQLQEAVSHLENIDKGIENVVSAIEESGGGLTE